MQKHLTVPASLAILLGLLGGCAGDAQDAAESEPVTLRLVHEEGAGDVQGQYAERFEKLVERRTDHRVDVVTYSAGQLGTNDDSLKMVEDNAVQAAISTPSITAPVVEENQALSIPFVFSDDMQVNRKVLDSSKALNQDLAGIYSDRGVEVLGYWTEGFMAWTSNRPIAEPEGMKGLRIRTMTSPMLLTTYEALGANPMPMDAGEIYTALQTNMIDATVNPLFFIYSGNTHEVQDYLTLGRHHIYVTSTIINADFLHGLPARDRKVIESTVDDLDDWVFDVQEQMNEDALTKMKASDISVVELTDSQREVYRKMSMKAREEYLHSADPRGADILRTLVREIKQAEGGRG
ncbi:TRAP transporter substrate-binding protein DctP [Janibacter corallicola]|uniref:TRAP transporter substrate-binding protein DctP n=1 Tax=Janibacter corallicola TaxID=415212 RepID=UPI0008377133|nr:TRAP transporter substrate-binding protein DctP [Janibacter corallicola]